MSGFRTDAVSDGSGLCWSMTLASIFTNHSSTHIKNQIPWYCIWWTTNVYRFLVSWILVSLPDCALILAKRRQLYIVNLLSLYKTLMLKGSLLILVSWAPIAPGTANRILDWCSSGPHLPNLLWLHVLHIEYTTNISTVLILANVMLHQIPISSQSSINGLFIER